MFTCRTIVNMPARIYGSTCPKSCIYTPGCAEHIVGAAHETRERKRHESAFQSQNTPVNSGLAYRAYASGARGREFESPRSDQFFQGLPNASHFGAHDMAHETARGLG